MSKTNGKNVFSSLTDRVDTYAVEARVAVRELDSVRFEIKKLERSQEQQLQNIGKAHLVEVIAQRVQGCTAGLQATNKKREAAISAGTRAYQNSMERDSALNADLKAATDAYYREKSLVDDACNSSPELAEARQISQAASLRADADQRAAEAAQVESRQKLAGYTKSVEFMHLLNRGFGTSQYNGSLLFAWGDRWLARKIDFPEAMRSYKMLVHLPDQAKAKAQSSLSTKEASVERVKLIKAEIERSSSLRDLFLARAKASDAVDMSTMKLKELGSKVREYQCLQDSEFSDMVSQLLVALKRMTQGELRVFVTATPTTEDDVALSSLLSAQHQLELLRVEEVKVKAEADRLEARHKQSCKLVRYFESEGYDGKRRIYDSSFDVDALITGYVLGQINQNAIDRMVRDSSSIQAEPRSYTAPSYSEPARQSSSSSSSSWSNSSSDDDRRRSSDSGFQNTNSFGGGSDSSSSGYTNTDSF